MTHTLTRLRLQVGSGNSDKRAQGATEFFHVCVL